MCVGGVMTVRDGGRDDDSGCEGLGGGDDSDSGGGDDSGSDGWGG